MNTPLKISSTPTRLLLSCVLAMLAIAAIGTFSGCAVTGERSSSGASIRKTIIDAVRSDMDRSFPGDFGPARPVEFLVEHLKTEGQWACFSGTARYRDTREPVDFQVTALLESQRDGEWKIVKVLYHGDVPTRRELIGSRQVPEVILPDWMR